ncbi:hypothetical protein N9L47_02430 [Rhodobacteraceae bacterium]|nr:hypothetical protein [Paracoccaceae bacterium]
MVNTLLLNGKESDQYMDGSTKILTVSYGTFSCTLEGFDDPLGAMRDIAEYFRDLAADDRYFGAEPPTPDVEMLQNLAEQDVNRRVEARTSDTGVSLRQVEHRKPKLDPEPVDQDNVEEPDAEDTSAIAARVAFAAKTADAGNSPKAEDTPDAGSGPLTFDDDFLMSDEPEDVLAVDPDARVLDEGPAESVAEKLRRIRAVVSKNIETKASTAEKDDIEDAEIVEAGKRDRAQTETIDEITADLLDDEETVRGTTADSVEVADAIESDKAIKAKGVPSSGEAIVAFDDDLKSDRAHIDNATAEDILVNDLGGDIDDHELPDLTFDDKTNAADDFERLEADEPASLFLDDKIDDSAEDADETVVADTTAENAKTEDDAAIKRTISDIIGSMAGQIKPDDYAEAQDDELAETTPVKSRPISKPLSAEQESDVGRLLEETDNKLNEDDVVRRRRVISQMRAAVAATKADRLVSRQVSREVVEEKEQSPYRDDLSEVVKPSTATASNGERPNSSTPPLVLVSSQRINPLPTESPSDGTSETSDQPKDFAGFVEDMGAKDLPELLEAAAAFAVFKEGQSSFTRPEIMKRVAAVDPTIRMSREESLRSFGQLLRQGKFHKLERGQFTIDQDTKFNPKRRIAGE